MMLQKPVRVKDVIGYAVGLVQTEILATIQANEIAANGTTSINALNYQYGHIYELLQTLAQMDQDPSGAAGRIKYPCVYLLMDIREQRGRQPGIYSEVNLDIVIMHQTDPTYKAADRYEHVFEPVLEPIYYSLIKQLCTIPQTEQGNQDMLTHDKWDRLFWGTSSIGGNTGLAVNDYVDAIELQNLDLKLNYQPCVNPYVFQPDVS